MIEVYIRHEGWDEGVLVGKMTPKQAEDLIGLIELTGVYDNHFYKNENEPKTRYFKVAEYQFLIPENCLEIIVEDEE